ncbi:hypothetical protein ANCCAN_12080 [Ancylostoma caninum]|uniref:Uncharacterized protein n=1 Tax=Ancylostoma caninum TaxID=29170 RepID=A0A368GG47_ANCCA|nr:hypothetical protein ANCCAN_12080 [Ancylostoma caninum]
MMEHEWPQNWPELNSQLLEMTTQGIPLTLERIQNPPVPGSLSCAIVFAILRRLVENVATLASVTSQRRRKDMHGAICDSTNDFLSVALDVLGSCPLDHMGTLAAKNIFGWLTELCSCMTSVSLEQQLLRIVDTVVRYLGTAERNIYEQAAQCLAAIAVRKKSLFCREKHDQSIIISAFFRAEVFSAILTTTGLAADGSQFSEQHYRYLKSLCELLTTLGNFLSRVWTEKSAPPNFETFLSAIVAFFNHDSLTLKYEACDVLVGLSSHKIFREDPSFMQAIREVFANSLKAIMKNGYPSQNPPNAATRYSHMDFDDDLEWHNMFIRYRSRVQLLMAENMPLHFSYLLTVYEETVLRRVILGSQTITELEWEAMQRFARNLIQVAYEKKFAEMVGHISEKERLVMMRDTLVNTMLNTSDCDILSEMLSLHSPFLSSYADDYEKLNTYFSLLRRGLLMSAGNKTLNRHVVSLILRAVQIFPAYFKEHVASIISLYSEVSEVISKMQMAQLLQVLAVLSNSVDDESVRLELLQMAAGPSVEYIRSISWSFESVSSFVTFNAFNVPPSDAAESSSTMNRIEGHVASIISLYSEVSEVISKMQMAQLLQVLAVLSNSVDDESVRLELLQMAAGPSIEYIRSISWSFESVSSFVTFNAFNVPPSDAAESSSTMNRIELRRALTCVQGVVQQVNSDSPLGTMLIPSYPSFFKLTRCLMELHLEQNKVLFHPLFRESLTKMVASERQQIYCSVGESIEVVSGRPAVADVDPITIERQYVHDLNDQAAIHFSVTIISAAVSKFPGIIFSLPEAPELLNCLVSSIDLVPEFKLRHWIKKGWKSVMGSCPANHWPLLKEFFARIASSMHTRLQKMWADVSHIDYDSEPTEEELFYEHLTCVISREYINFLRCCYLPSEGEFLRSFFFLSSLSEDKAKALTMTPLGEWLFSNNVGLSSVIMTVFSSLTFRDSLLALRAIALCKALSEKLMECYDDEVGVYMLVCAIRSLQLHGADEVAGTPLIGLVFHIYCALRRFSDSLPQVLMQIPEVTAEIVETFDSKIRAMIAGDEILLEKQKKDMARRLLKGVITLTVGEQHKKPVYLRPLPPIEKRRRADNEPDDFADIALLFAEGRD